MDCSAIKTRLALDVQGLMQWLDGENASDPITIIDAEFQASRFDRCGVRPPRHTVGGMYLFNMEASGTSSQVQFRIENEPDRGNQIGHAGFQRFCVRLRHTSHVHGILRSVTLAAALGLLSWSCHANGAATWQAAVTAAAQTAPEARIVVLEVSTGRLVAAYRLSEAARTLAAPGSTLKPLVLFNLIAAGRWNPDRRISCDRRLRIAGHSLACSHPSAPPFDAREALTWSCNSYFAGVARSLQPGELAAMLRPTGLLGATGLATNEAVAEFREPRTADDEQLALLGVVGIRVSPLELAEAYRWLALQMASYEQSPATQVVRKGLMDSADFGMAGEASRGEFSVAGKTGTAEGVASARTHGWFAGLAPAAHPRVVVVVFEPTGRGADAAHVAGEILRRAPGEERR